GSGSYYIGGILGYTEYSSNSLYLNLDLTTSADDMATYQPDLIINNCYNTGAVTGSDNSSFVGGICGAFSTGTISSCYNSGKIAGGDSSNYIGGICGMSGYGTISGCYNKGTIDGVYMCAGGICGDVEVSVINSCYNEGTVTAAMGAGGICGTGGNMTGAANYISNCYNTGSICADSYYAGGICGMSVCDKITGCYSKGTVTADSYETAIASTSSGTVTNCCYLKDTAAAGVIDSTDSDTGAAEIVTEAQFNSGYAAWLLSGETEGADWLQTIGTDTYPVLAVFSSSSLPVVELTLKDNSSAVYANVLNSGITVKYDGTALSGILIDTNTYGGNSGKYLEGAYIAIDGTLYQISSFYYTDADGSEEENGDYAFFLVVGETEKSGAAVRGGIITKDSAQSETVYYYVTSESEGLTVSADSAAATE
ncbi:MAG: hypothetical protein LUD77_10900, partial [Clostridiales bacterium]|nr:hypothetical protein [Clostridiales bacterium]